jgi:hypothetical protein
MAGKRERDNLTMIIDQELRGELIKEFIGFSEAGGNLDSCFDEWVCLNNEDLYFAIRKLRPDCSSCAVLFPKLRDYVYYGPFLDGNTYCMCHFTSAYSKTKDFQQAVKKAWRYINGEWG